MSTSRSHTKRISTIFIAWFAVLACWRAGAQECYLFAGSYNGDKELPGMYVFSLDTITGTLRKISEVRDVLNPAFLSIAPDGKHVYACTEARIPDAGSVAAYSFSPQPGTLTFVNQQSSHGENPVSLQADKTGKWLVNANYTAGSVSVYPLAADGSIGTAAQVIPFTGSSVNTERQDRAHIHQVVFSPGQHYIFFPDLGSDKIWCLGFDASESQPLKTVVRLITPALPGTGPRHLVFHPNSKWAYCTEEMGGAITVYKYGYAELDSIQRISTQKRNTHRAFSNADIHISADGAFLYASDRTDNKIVVFAIDSKRGTLTLVDRVSTRGDHPRSFTIDPSGKYLLVANQISGDIVVFRRDANTGKLTRTGVKVKVPGVSCLQMRQY